LAKNDTEITSLTKQTKNSITCVCCQQAMVDLRLTWKRLFIKMTLSTVFWLSSLTWKSTSVYF